jgi:hypothetical protein
MNVCVSMCVYVRACVCACACVCEVVCVVNNTQHTCVELMCVFRCVCACVVHEQQRTIIILTQSEADNRSEQRLWDSNKTHVHSSHTQFVG